MSRLIDAEKYESDLFKVYDDVSIQLAVLENQPTVDAIIIPEGATREQVFEVVFGIGMMMAGLKNMDWWRTTYKAESEG